MTLNTIEKFISIHPIVNIGLGIGLTLLVNYFINRYKERQRDKLEDKTEETLEQSFICLEPKLLSCHLDKLNISEIPELLKEYRKTFMHIGKNDEVRLWDTRISTYLAITDGNRILFYDREVGATSKKQVINNKLDCYGARNFHNDTLVFKLPSQIFDCKVQALVPIPGLAVEKNRKQKKMFFKHFVKKEDISIIIGFVCLISPENLDKGKNHQNKIYNLNKVHVEDFNLTSKSKLALKYVKTNIQTIQKINSSIKESNSFCSYLRRRLLLV